MRVCIVRNAEAESNANMMRAVDALLYGGYDVILLSRKRDSVNNSCRVVKKNLQYKNATIENYEIQLSTIRNNGIKNLMNLVHYIFIVIF